MKKPKLLIIGHARHGKDTVAEIFAEQLGLKFTSSSVFVGKEIIWDKWGKDRYNTFEEMFEDRVSKENRIIWGNLIAEYNTPDKTKTATTMLDRGYDMYVGMRRIEELEACLEKELFDHIIWVDATNRLPLEDPGSMTIDSTYADIFIDNNGTEEELKLGMNKLCDLFTQMYPDIRGKLN